MSFGLKLLGARFSHSDIHGFYPAYKVGFEIASETNSEIGPVSVLVNL